jgi:hypothetical protein
LKTGYFAFIIINGELKAASRLEAESFPFLSSSTAVNSAPMVTLLACAASGLDWVRAAHSELPRATVTACPACFSEHDACRIDKLAPLDDRRDVQAPLADAFLKPRLPLLISTDNFLFWRE